MKRRRKKRRRREKRRKRERRREGESVAGLPKGAAIPQRSSNFKRPH